MIVDSAVYVDGRRTAEALSPAETRETLRRQRGGLAWIGLHAPAEEEFFSVACEFGLHPLAVEDAVNAHQRPKLERYDGGTPFVVLRPARYVDETESVEFGEVHVLMREDFEVTVRHGGVSELGKVSHRLEGDLGLLRLGPQAILYAVTDRMVDDYASVVAGLENDIDEIETEVFSGNEDVSRRIYKLSREVIQFQRATEPLPGILEDLIGHAGDPDLQMYLRDVRDHTLHTTEQLRAFRELLQNILSVNLTLVGISQNEEVKGLTRASVAQADEVKMISAWAAILFAPTLVGAVYGMNFDHMPELRWTLGYPFALTLMLVVSVSLYLAFKRRGWS